MRIAVLDSDHSQAELICQVLTAAGHACHEFQSGKEMLGQLRKDSCDMLILDWHVSDLDGAEVLRRAREKLAPKAPVLFMTNSSGED
ncbi:MAG: response regulator, partial [Janthinobacterium sp.]